MVFAGINYLAIVIAAVAGFAFGAVYYMALSKPWLTAIGKTRQELMPSGRPAPTSLVHVNGAGFTFSGLVR